MVTFEMLLLQAEMLMTEPEKTSCMTRMKGMTVMAVATSLTVAEMHRQSMSAANEMRNMVIPISNTSELTMTPSNGKRMPIRVQVYMARTVCARQRRAW